MRPAAGTASRMLSQHLLGQREVEQRVDEQRGLAVDDQPGVAPPPAAVGLQVGVQTVAHLLQTLDVAHLTPRVALSPRAVGRGRQTSEAATSGPRVMALRRSSTSK